MSDEYQVRFVTYNSFSVDRDANVHYVTEDSRGRREWSEPLCDSPVQCVLPEWMWDALLDPRIDRDS